MAVAGYGCYCVVFLEGSEENNRVPWPNMLPSNVKLILSVVFSHQLGIEGVAE